MTDERESFVLRNDEREEARRAVDEAIAATLGGKEIPDLVRELIAEHRDAARDLEARILEREAEATDYRMDTPQAMDIFLLLSPDAGV